VDPRASVDTVLKKKTASFTPPAIESRSFSP